MKTVLRMPGLLSRFGLVASALLFGQQALAVGTDAGTDVTNVASVSYSVNGQGQTAIPSNSADFVVDPTLSDLHSTMSLLNMSFLCLARKALSCLSFDGREIGCRLGMALH